MMTESTRRGRPQPPTGILGRSRANSQGKMTSSGGRPSVGYDHSLRNVKKILIVDDTPEGRQALKQALTPAGHHHLRGGVRPTRDRTPSPRTRDLILLDFAMPGLDGEEVARRIRADATLREVSIVMVSDDTREPIRARALAAGANEFLPKNVPPDALLARVERLVHVATRKPTQLLAQVQPTPAHLPRSSAAS